MYYKAFFACISNYYVQTVPRAGFRSSGGKCSLASPRSGEMDADSGCHIAHIIDCDSSNCPYLFSCINSEITAGFSLSLPDGCSLSFRE